MRALAEIDSTLQLAEKRNSRFAEGITHWLLAWIYFDRSQLHKSEFHYNKWFQYRIKATPQYLKAHQADRAFFKGLIFLEQANVDSAKIQLIKLEQVLPDVFVTVTKRLTFRKYLLHTSILIAENSLTEAEQAYQTIRKTEIPFQLDFSLLARNMPIMQDALAQAFQREGNLEKAISIYEQLLRFDPPHTDWRFRNPRYHYRLGLLYEQSGQIDKAAESYEKFLHICALADSNNEEIINAKKRLANVGRSARSR
jgi:tetratricopeptide (TPR) repeat protein